MATHCDCHNTRGAKVDAFRLIGKRGDLWSASG